MRVNTTSLSTNRGTLGVPHKHNITTLLVAVAAGDAVALNHLLSMMYDELRTLARARLRKSGNITSLDTTELVHESYLRFLKTGRVEVNDRAHFMSYAASVMRSIVVDFVRQRRSERHGGDALHVTLSTDMIGSQLESEQEIMRINDALEALSQSEPRLVKVVEMRYFAGLSEAEIALSLGVTDRTVRRDWEKARLLLSAVLHA